MDYQTEDTPALRRRYRVLAGPFLPTETSLLTGLLGHLAATGARITTVMPASGGVEVWRLRSECETYLETELRLARIRPIFPAKR